MDIYCEQHNHDSDYDDDKLLLDDENTNTIDSCAKCRRRSYSTNGFIKPTSSNGNHSTVVIANGFNDGPLNNMETELLVNTQYSDLDNIHMQQDIHCHINNTSNEEQKALKKLFCVMLLCFFFMITEVVGGYIAGSLAVMTDAAHLFSDIIGFLVSILSIWIGKKPATQVMTFGYHRAEVLGAFLSVLAVWLLAGVFCVLAISRLLKKEYEIDVDTMLIVSSIGVIINILMGAILHGICHSHSHGLRRHSQHENINVRAAAAHVLGDLLQSIGVLVAAIIIKIFPNAEMADPICTLLFSIIVVYATLKVAYDAIKILVEASPKHVADFIALFSNISGVKHVHGLHVWSLSPGKDAIAVHLAVDQYCDRDTVLNQATSLIRSHLSVVSCTIQIEKYNENQVGACNQ